ncbi:MAG TPA: hypothetical protein PK406_14280, partial [Verrucomicrobiota bacterium]|nr:hypothetical protein [Verrucomicrobiota bacterium]
YLHFQTAIFTPCLRRRQQSVKNAPRWESQTAFRQHPGGVGSGTPLSRQQLSLRRFAFLGAIQDQLLILLPQKIAKTRKEKWIVWPMVATWRQTVGAR